MSDPLLIATPAPHARGDRAGGVATDSTGVGGYDSVDPSGKYKGKNFDPNYRARHDRLNERDAPHGDAYGHGHGYGRGRGRGRGHAPDRGHGRGRGRGRGGRYGDERAGRFGGQGRSRSRSRSKERDQQRGYGRDAVAGRDRSYHESQLPQIPSQSQPPSQPYPPPQPQLREPPRELPQDPRRRPAPYVDQFDQAALERPSAVSPHPQDTRFSDRSPYSAVDAYRPKRPTEVNVGLDTADRGSHSGTLIISPAHSHLPTPSLTSTSTASTSTRTGKVQSSSSELQAPPPRSASATGGPSGGMPATLDSLAKLRQFKAEVEASRSAKAGLNANASASVTASAHVNAKGRSDTDPQSNVNTNNSAGAASIAPGSTATTSGPLLTSGRGTGMGMEEFDTSQLAKMAQSFIEKRQKQVQPQPQPQPQPDTGNSFGGASAYQGNSAITHVDRSQGGTQAQAHLMSGADREQELRERLKSRASNTFSRSPQAQVSIQKPYDHGWQSIAETYGSLVTNKSPPKVKHLPPLPSDPRFTRREVNDRSRTEVTGSKYSTGVYAASAGETSTPRNRDGDPRGGATYTGHQGHEGGPRDARYDQRDTARDHYEPLSRQGHERRPSQSESCEEKRLTDRTAGAPRPPSPALPYALPSRPRPRSRSRSRSPQRTRDTYTRAAANPPGNRTGNYPEIGSPATAAQRWPVGVNDRSRSSYDRDEGRTLNRDPYESYAARRGLPTAFKGDIVPASPHAPVDRREHVPSQPPSAREDPRDYGHTARGDARYPDSSSSSRELEPIRVPYPRRSPPPVARRPLSPLRPTRVQADQRAADRTYVRDPDQPRWAHPRVPSASSDVARLPPSTAATAAPAPPSPLEAIGLDTNNVVETLAALKAQISKLEKLVPAALANAATSSTIASAGAGPGATTADRGYPRPYSSGPPLRTRSRSRSPVRPRLDQSMGEIHIQDMATPLALALDLALVLVLVPGFLVGMIAIVSLGMITTTKEDTTMIMKEDADEDAVEVGEDREVEAVAVGVAEAEDMERPMRSRKCGSQSKKAMCEDS
ncbi:hypothetical protein IAU59_003097 [Kwoniella sp. CBS 9459]